MTQPPMPTNGSHLVEWRGCEGREAIGWFELGIVDAVMNKNAMEERKRD